MHAFKKARRGGVKGKKELQAGAKLKRGKKRVLSAEAERAPDHVVLEVGDRTGVPREDNLHCPVGCISCILATAAVLGLLWNLRSFVDTIDDNLGGAFQAGVCTVNGFEGPRPKEPSLAQSNLMSPPPPPAGMPLYFPKCYFKDATTADDTVACKNGEAKDAPKFFATAADKEGKGQGYIPSGRWCPGVGLCRHLNVTFEDADGNQSVATSAQWTSTMARDLGAERASAADGEVTFTGRRWSQADYPTWSAGAFPEWFGAANGSAAGEGSAVSEAQLAAAFREYVYDPRGLELRLPLDRESLDHRASTDSPYPYVGEWCAAPPHRPPARPPRRRRAPRLTAPARRRARSTVLECWEDLDMAKAAIAALESVYAAGAQTPCYRYEKEPGDAYASSPRLRQGAAAEVVAANKLVVFSPLSFDGLGSFFLAVGATLLCCGCYCFLCCREWWCRSKWRKIRLLQHF